MKALAFSILALVLSVASLSAAETKITLSGVHLCCKSCVKGVEEAAKASGATVTADMETKKVSIVAKDDKEAQAAVDAISAAGYYGASDNANVKMAPASVGDGKVKDLAVTTHNCCAKCTKAIDAAAKTAPGVTEVAATPKDNNITVKGEFDAKAEAKAMNDAGFQLNTKK